MGVCDARLQEEARSEEAAPTAVQGLSSLPSSTTSPLSSRPTLMQLSTLLMLLTACPMPAVPAAAMASGVPLAVFDGEGRDVPSTLRKCYSLCAVVYVL